MIVCLYSINDVISCKKLYNSILCIVIVGEEFVCMSRGGCSAVFISLSEETAELVLRWKANGMQNLMCSVHKLLLISSFASALSPHQSDNDLMG